MRTDVCKCFSCMDTDACEEHYRTFAEIINQALGLLREEDDDWARAAKLYAYVATHMSYGSVYDAYGIEMTVYNAIVHGLGLCGDYAAYLNLLLRHCGIPAVCGHSWGEDGLGGADHAWRLPVLMAGGIILMPAGRRSESCNCLAFLP